MIMEIYEELEYNQHWVFLRPRLTWLDNNVSSHAHSIILFVNVSIFLSPLWQDECHKTSFHREWNEGIGDSIWKCSCYSTMPWAIDGTHNKIKQPAIIIEDYRDLCKLKTAISTLLLTPTNYNFWNNKTGVFVK